MLLVAPLVLLAAHAVGADTYNVVVNGVTNEPLTVIGDAWTAASVHSAVRSAPQYPTHLVASCSRSKAGGGFSQPRV